MILGVVVLSPDSGLLRLIDGDPYGVILERDGDLFGFVGSGVGPVAGRIRIPADTIPRCLLVSFFLSVCLLCPLFSVSPCWEHRQCSCLFLTPLASAFASRICSENRPTSRYGCDRSRNHWRINFGFRDPGRHLRAISRAFLSLV